MADLAWLNQASPRDAADALFRCCGWAGWAIAMAASRPFGSREALFAAAEAQWARASREDILEAFSHHPRIGDREALSARFPGTHQWSEGEQSAAASSDARVLDELAAANRDYEKRFGHIFIVCATSKTAPEILSLLRSRLGHDPEAELKVAAAEQMKITRLRLEKLLQEREQTTG
jgi:2-oxo-4-hydroxy-4-carboxy-5-ureidoimidazoline decarboxylase